MLGLRWGLAAALLLAAIASTAPAADRLPVPDAEAQAQALDQVKQLFDSGYHDQSPAGQEALASKLLQDAGDAAGDPAGRFVMLGRARDIAGDLGDVDTALAAAYRLEDDFSVRPASSLLAALTALRKAALPPLPEARIVIASLDAINRALHGQDVEAATKLAAILESAAGRSLDPRLIAAARERSAAIRIALEERGSVAAARKTLEQRPKDPRASLIVGRFLCFQLDRWDEGLPLLADCAEPKLRALARLDSSDPSEPKEMLKVAEQWAALAKSSRGLEHEHQLAHAVDWYRKAIPALSGLEKVKAGEELKAATAVIQPWGPLAYVTASGTKGIDLGMGQLSVGRQFLIEFEVKTTWNGDAILLSKRHREPEGCLTVYLQSNGAAGVATDASFYTVKLDGKRVINDGHWHAITVEKVGGVVRLIVDHALEGQIDTRTQFRSQSPWTLGWHEIWNRGSLDAEFRHVWIAGWN